MISKNFSKGHCILFGVLIVIFLFLFYPVARELINEWRSDPEFSHGFLIPFVSMYLIWSQREKVIALISDLEDVEFRKIILLIIGLLIFIIGRFLQHVFIEGIAMVVVLSGIILYLFGLKILKAVLFPICYLFFMLPIPYSINYFVANKMKFFIANSTKFLLNIGQIPVFLDGNTLNLTSISLEVVESCSGIQTIISFIAIGAVFAYLRYNSNFFRLIVVIMAIPFAILTNILRVSAIGAISYYFSNSLAHHFHGYAWIMIVFMGVLGYASIDRFIYRWY